MIIGQWQIVKFNYWCYGKGEWHPELKIASYKWWRIGFIEFRRWKDVEK